MSDGYSTLMDQRIVHLEKKLHEANEEIDRLRGRIEARERLWERLINDRNALRERVRELEAQHHRDIELRRAVDQLLFKSTGYESRRLQEVRRAYEMLHVEDET